MKWQLYLGLILILIVSTLAETMCSDTIEPNTPCRLVTPSLSCSTYNYTLINSTNGIILNSGNLINLNTSIYYLSFNQTEGYYIIKLCDSSTRELYVQSSQEGKMFFSLGLILLPILIGFLLIYSSTTLNEEHGILKMFLFILGFITPIIAYQYSMELISTQSTLSLLQNSTGQHSSIFSWVFYIIVIYFILFSAIMLIKYLMERKKEKLEYD